jgi:branched-chain amino acid transport system substrate-binding protein
MKIKRLSWVGISILVLLSVCFVSMLGCNTSVTNTSPNASTNTSSSSNPAAAAETIKIGLAAAMQSNVSLDWIRATELLVERDNKNGGLEIGGIKYNIKLIEYDSENDQTKEIAAINRLVYEDGVKFIIAQGNFANSWFDVTEKNKIVTFTSSPPAQINCIPSLHYSFVGTGLNPLTSVTTGWYCEKHPELIENVVFAYPDNQLGHIFDMFVSQNWKSYNVPYTSIFFPANSQDLSALGTKVLSMNPTTFGCVAESDSVCGLVFNAVRDAGYKGQLFAANNLNTEALNAVMNKSASEGFICGADATEFDPSLTKEAEDFKALWIDKYGKWESPNLSVASAYCALEAGLMQAGTIDADKVADVLSSGLKYNGASGQMQMISRPDLGNDRTVDSISTYYVKQVTNGNPVLLDTINIDESLAMFRKAFPAAPAGGPPAGGPPSGAAPASGPPTEIPWDKAADYMGKNTLVSVTEAVFDVMSTPMGDIVLLGGGMGTGLGISIQDSSIDASALKGKTITVVGVVTTSMMGGPEIAVTSVDQITVK